MQKYHPGKTYTPQNNPEVTDSSKEASVPPAPEVATVSTNPEEDASASTATPSSEAPKPAPGAETVASIPLFSWQASEYIAHQRGGKWYGVLIIGTVLLVTGSYFLLGFLSALVILLTAITVTIYARRTPSVLNYSLGPNGIIIDQKLYPYTDFRAFAVVPDKGWLTIELDPLRRFMPRLTIFFAREDGETITGILEQHLPRNDRQPDFIERLSRYLKF